MPAAQKPAPALQGADSEWLKQIQNLSEYKSGVNIGRGIAGTQTYSANALVVR